MLRRFNLTRLSVIINAASPLPSQTLRFCSSSSSEKDKEKALDNLMSAFASNSNRNNNNNQHRNNNNANNNNTVSNKHQNNRNRSPNQNQQRGDITHQNIHHHHQQQQQQQNLHQQQLEQQQLQTQMRNLERKLAQMSNDEFSYNHLQSLVKQNIGKIPQYVIHVTLNEAEKRISLLPHKAVRDVFILSSASRHGDRLSNLQIQQLVSSSSSSSSTQSQQQQQNQSTTIIIASSTTPYAARCVSLFLQRAKTHSRDHTFALIDTVVDSAYQTESFDNLVALSEFAADKLIFSNDDFPTDVSLFRVLWRVVCLGVKRLTRIRQETRRVSLQISNLANNTNNKNPQTHQNNTGSQNNNNSNNDAQQQQREKLTQQLKQLHQEQQKEEVSWREAADKVWHNMSRCNPNRFGAGSEHAAASKNSDSGFVVVKNSTANSSSSSSTRSSSSSKYLKKHQVMTTLFRFVLYGSGNNIANININQQQNDHLVAVAQQQLDWGEMHCYHFWYEHELFVCCSTTAHGATLTTTESQNAIVAPATAKPLQLYVSLIRTCRPGLWLEQAQLYFEEYQQQQQSKSSSVDRESAAAAATVSEKQQGGIEEILIFTLFSVFQQGKDYKRICALGKNLIASVSSMVITNGGGGGGGNTDSSKTPVATRNQEYQIADCISASVLATISQAAGETHDALLVNQCLTLLLRKFEKASEMDSSPTNSGSSAVSSHHLQQQQDLYDDDEFSSFEQEDRKQNNKYSKSSEENSQKSSNNSSVNNLRRDNLPSTFTLFQALSAAAKSGALRFPELVEHCIKNGWVTAENTTTTTTNNNPHGISNSAARDVRLHLLLQWAAATSNVHEEAEKILTQLEHEIKQAKKKILPSSTSQNEDVEELAERGKSSSSSSSSSSHQKSPNNQELARIISTQIISERCLNHILQLLHRIEHKDYLKWFKLGTKSLGYFRQQWMEMLVLWADRRRYSLKEEERRFVLDEFRRSRLSESGLRPMLALLKFDLEEKPLEKFKNELAKSKKSLPSSFIESGPSITDPRAHFLRRGGGGDSNSSSSSAALSLSNNPTNNNNNNSAATRVLQEFFNVPQFSCDHDDGESIVISAFNKSCCPLSCAMAPPQLHSNFVSKTTNHQNQIVPDKNNSTQQQIDNDNDDDVQNKNNNNINNNRNLLLLQWFLCTTLEGMELQGNSYGIVTNHLASTSTSKSSYGVKTTVNRKFVVGAGSSLSIFFEIGNENQQTGFDDEANSAAAAACGGDENNNNSNTAARSDALESSRDLLMSYRKQIEVAEKQLLSRVA